MRERRRGPERHVPAAESRRLACERGGERTVVAGHHRHWMRARHTGRVLRGALAFVRHEHGEGGELLLAFAALEDVVIVGSWWDERS